DSAVLDLAVLERAFQRQRRVRPSQDPGMAVAGLRAAAGHQVAHEPPDRHRGRNGDVRPPLRADDCYQYPSHLLPRWETPAAWASASRPSAGPAVTNAESSRRSGRRRQPTSTVDAYRAKPPCTPPAV